MTRRQPFVPILALAALGLLAPLAAAAGSAAAEPAPKPFLWQIDGKTPSYLFGTIHVPDARVVDLPESVERVLDAADVVLTEIPLDGSTQSTMLGAAMLPGDETLADLMPAELYQRTASYLQTKGLVIQAFNKMKVWVLSTQLSMLDYLPQMMTTQPLDMQIFSSAQAAGKTVGGLETVEEQLGVFEALTLEQQIALHGQALDQLEEAAAKNTSPARELVEVYLLGDGEALLDKMHETVDEDDPTAKQFMKLLIEDRNARMAGRIAKKLAAAPESGFFFAIGAGHMPGEQGIVALLREAGLTVTRVAAAPVAAPAEAAEAPAAAGR